MNEPPQLLKPTRHFSGHSPTRHRDGDELLSRLSPATAVEMLASPVGALKTSMDAASADDQEFARRTALASRTVWQWVEELSEWTWPVESGPAGFEIPNKKPKKPSIEVTVPKEEENNKKKEEDGTDDSYMGSLTARDVTTYEARIAQIHRDLDDLAVEEIKSHVLTHHIWPLSRPSTPMSDSGLSRISISSSYNKMEDLTAVITAIVMQTLPNLARLSRLLQLWKIRLSVIQQIPDLLLAMEDADMAIKSGWKAISLRSTRADPGTEDDSNGPALTRDGFNVMKLILEKKVSNTQRSLDYMLDSVEGLPDTLPSQWLDRMEALERDYGEWVAACESILRSSGWGRAGKTRSSAARSPSPVKGRKLDDKTPARRSSRPPAAHNESSTVALPVPAVTQDLLEPSKQRRDRKNIPIIVASGPEAKGTEPPQNNQEGEPAEPMQHSEVPVQSTYGSFDGAQDELAGTQRQTTTPATPQVLRRADSEESDDQHENLEPELSQDDDYQELPPLVDSSRRSSNVSDETTVLHGASSHFDGMSSDLPEVSASPAIARNRIREAEYVADEQASPPSSPPMPPTDVGESSVLSLGSPWNGPIREEDENMSIDGSYLDDFDDSFSIAEFPGSISRRESTSDLYLRQQISDIIDGIPAKIKLSNEPPKVNLNPPDLQLPKLRKRPSVEPFKRSTSSLSSRAGTPSFTLSPAKNVRARHQRSQQEIKVYHLSRSTGEAPIKLFIRCVGENGERVMVRVGGGWADLGEYLKEYASHHGRRSKGADKAKVEVRDVPRAPSGTASNLGSSPGSRPASALDMTPATPLAVRKTRRSVGAASSEAREASRLQPKTPAVAKRGPDTTPSSEESTGSRSNSRLSWRDEDDSSLGLAGPTGKKVEMSAENKAWVESVKQKVRLASGERRSSGTDDRGRFGELGKVGGTKRLFPKAEDRREMKK